MYVCMYVCMYLFIIIVYSISPLLGKPLPCSVAGGDSPPAPDLVLGKLTFQGE